VSWRADSANSAARAKSVIADRTKMFSREGKAAVPTVPYCASSLFVDRTMVVDYTIAASKVSCIALRRILL
jgi:hypothetical protein